MIIKKKDMEMIIFIIIKNMIMKKKIIKINNPIIKINDIKNKIIIIKKNINMMMIKKLLI